MKEKGIRSLKIALAALLAIALAGELGLQSPTTAGIITILSIQSTKLETVKTAGKRAIAFLCALVIAGICFWLMGYTLWAYALYLFLFVMLCLVMNWPEAITVDSVLISHFLSQNCFLPLLGNEVLLFGIGTGVGILVNLHLRSSRDRFTEVSDRVDQQIRGILGSMAEYLADENPSDGEEFCFAALKEALQQAEECAVANYGNTLFPRKALAAASRDTYELDYVRMRQQQTVILQAACENIRELPCLPRQAGQVAKLLEQIRREYHRYNNVEGLLQRLRALLTDMQLQPLPESREEFEARAVLFYLLKQLEELLEIKKEFISVQGGAEYEAELQNAGDV